MLSRAITISYDTSVFPFADLLETRIFKTSPLSELHKSYRRFKRKRFGSDDLGYRDNLDLRKLMQDQSDDSSLIKLYRCFVAKVIAPNFGGRISYSSRPKMRVHLAQTPSVSKWHRDVDVTGRYDQINAFLPFTTCRDEAALWCESDYGLGDYSPIPLEYGQIFLFDGGCLSHGTVANSTNLTRVSLDFRFAPEGNIVTPWSEILGGRANQDKMRLSSNTITSQ